LNSDIIDDINHEKPINVLVPNFVNTPSSPSSSSPISCTSPTRKVRSLNEIY